jgi:hypothetical protein
MFGIGSSERVEMEGLATLVQVRTHTSGHVGPNGGHVSTNEVMTFRLVPPGVEGASSPSPVSVEVLARRFRGEVAENDAVRITGIWKERGGYLRALRVDNLTAQRTVKGSRWG